MTHSDDTKRENAALRERIAALNAASLCISASLHFDTVLAEVVQSARGPTSPAGVVVLDGQSGQPMSVNREVRRIVEGLRTRC